MPNLKELRIKLGLSQEGVAARALTSGEVRRTFNGITVRRAELPKPIGLGSYEVRAGLAAGLGLTLDDLSSFLQGRSTLEETIAKSSIVPNLDMVHKLEIADRTRSGRDRTGSLENAPPYRTTHPNLASTVEWCRGQFSDPFLDQYAADAVRSGGDRPRAVWFDEMRAKFWEWKQKAPKAPVAAPKPAQKR